MTSAASGVTAARVLGGLSALLVVPWIWTILGSTTRGSAIAWLALTASIGILWVCAGAGVVAKRSGRARWGGWASILAGLGMVGLAVAMLPIAYEMTWAV